MHFIVEIMGKEGLGGSVVKVQGIMLGAKGLMHMRCKARRVDHSSKAHPFFKKFLNIIKGKL